MALVFLRQPLDTYTSFSGLFAINLGDVGDFHREAEHWWCFLNVGGGSVGLSYLK